MFLIHKPSKIGIMLGKRMACGWYDAPESEELERFYDYIKDDMVGSQDDFLLAMENCSQSDCFNNWEYTEERLEGFIVFKLK